MTINSRFNTRINNIPNRIWLTITQIDELKGQWVKGARLSPQVLGRLKRSVLITSTGASTRIEGSTLSDQDIEKMIRGLSIQKFTNRDKQEVQGYYKLLENIFNSWQTLNLSESSIKHFHSELLKYVDKDIQHRGNYKKQENKVHMVNQEGESIGILFDTTPAYLTSKEMQELVEWTNQTLADNHHHPLLIIANFLVEFLKIHPFQDGNGRLSRILTNLVLLQSGYLYLPYVSHEKLIEHNKPEYYLTLRKSQKTINSKQENIIPWIEFFLAIFLKQSKMAIELISLENIEKLLTGKQLTVWEYLKTNHSSPLEISKATKIAYGTVRQALDKLMKLKQIERTGQGRSTIYKPI